MLSFSKLSLSLLIIFCNTAFAQFVPVSLNQRIENSSTIMEGKVISQVSYWDETKTNIYTSNVVEVYKLFKGNLETNKVEIITRGGVIGDRIERVTNLLTLRIGETGIFMAIPDVQKTSTNTKFPKFKTYAGIQGFIKYNLENGSAADLFNQYKYLGADLYQKIMIQTKQNIKIIQKAPFKTS